MIASAKEKVSRGAKFMDEKAPGWASMIKLDEFYMANADHCVLGQVFPDKGYTNKLCEFAAQENPELENFNQQYSYGIYTLAQELGFSVSAITSWETLEKHWIEEIKARLDS